MKKVLLVLLVLVTGFVLVGCKPEVTPPVEEEEKVLINTIIFKDVESTEDKALPTSASKIVFGDTYELDFNGIKGRADGFALASGTGTPLKGEFILKAFKEDISFLEIDLEEAVEIELDLHMWYTKTAVQWLGELRLNDEVVIKGMEALGKEIKTFKLTLNKGVNRFEYESVGGSYASQLVFKEMRVIK